MNKKIIATLAIALSISSSVVTLNATTPTTTPVTNTQTNANAQSPATNTNTNVNSAAQKTTAQLNKEKELAAQANRKKEGEKVISKLPIWKFQKAGISKDFVKAKPWLNVKTFNSWKAKVVVLGQQIARKNKGVDLVNHKKITWAQVKTLRNKFLNYRHGYYYSSTRTYNSWVKSLNGEVASLMRLNSGINKINHRHLSKSRRAYFMKSFLAHGARVTKSLSAYNSWVKWFWKQPAVLSNAYHFANCAAFKNGTFVDVNRSKQVLCAYINGKLAHGANVVTGDHSKGRDTPAGTWRIWNKSRNVTLVGSTVGHGADYNYRIPVKYWMPIDNTGVGLHSIDPDEVTGSWGRVYWGKDAYLTGRGSHGCVNMHTPDASWVFNHMPLNTKVVVR